MRFSIQNWIVCKYNEIDQIKMIASAGFKYADWDLCRFNANKKECQESEVDTIDYYKTLRAEADKLGLTIWMTHTIFPTYMDDENRESVQRRIDKCFIASNILGAKYTIVHPMMPKKWEGEENRELRVRKNIAFYDSLAPLAEKYNVGICIENMFGFPCGYGKYNETACSRYDEMLEIFEGIEKKEFFSFCYDSGHSNLTYKANHPDMIKALGANIGTVHLHDNNAIFDFHRLPGHGNLKWDEVMANIKDVGFDGVYNFEIAPTELKGFNKQKRLKKIHDSLEAFLQGYDL